MKRHKSIMRKSFGRLFAFAALVLCLGLLGCAEDSESGSSASLIVGSWKADMPCYETYVYNKDNTFGIHSRNKLLTGTYTFASDATSDGLYKLTLNITTESEDSSCNYVTTTDGPTPEFHVLFSNKNQTHNLYTVSGVYILSADLTDLSGEIGF